MNTKERTHGQDLQRLKLLRYMDDEFLTVCFADNLEDVELILKIILGREDIPDRYIIFITERDIMNENRPIYPVERYIAIGGDKVLFGDDSYILHVNGKYRGDAA